MSPARKQELEKRAAAHLEQYPDDVEAVQIVVEFAVEIEREVWEKITKELEQRHRSCRMVEQMPYAERGWNEKAVLLFHLIDWCREQGGG